MKISLKKELVNLSGKPLEGDDGVLTLGRALANILVSSKEGGKMKLFILAQKLYKDKEIELDSSDLSLVKKTVEKAEIYNALVIGQCELLLEDVKEEKSKK